MTTAKSKKSTTSVKKRSRNTVTLTVKLPDDALSYLNEVASLADVTLDTLISVILAMEVVKERKHKQSR